MGDSSIVVQWLIKAGDPRTLSRRAPPGGARMTCAEIVMAIVDPARGAVTVHDGPGRIRLDTASGRLFADLTVRE